MDLYEHARQEQLRKEGPLAARMRPRTLDEFVGQDHIIGAGRLLRRAIETDRLFSSLIFWGPPGCGKTTLGLLIAQRTRMAFETLNAVLAGLPELRKIAEAAKERVRLHGQRTILLIDEIHRWNKAQQDALLPIVEDGTLILIGATTENPYFSIIPPLISRSRVFRFEALTAEHIGLLLDQALRDEERGYGRIAVVLTPEARAHLAEMAGGDARSALNALELAVESTPPDPDGVRRITVEVAAESIQRRALHYDRAGDEHYDTISAFIKSIRGSDPDAALYYLGKMVSAGEDPRFIFRRLLILAAEDVGLADPWAMLLVNSCAQAFEWVGMPEGQYHLAEATLYVATAPKSNSVGAYWDVLAYLEEHGYQPPPLYLRDKSSNLSAGLAEQYRRSVGAQVSYRNPHDYPGSWVEQRYLPEGVEGGWFRPRGHGFEQRLIERLNRMRGQASSATPPRKESEE